LTAFLSDDQKYQLTPVYAPNNGKCRKRAFGLWILNNSLLDDPEIRIRLTHSDYHGDLLNPNSRVYPNGGKWLNTIANSYRYNFQRNRKDKLKVFKKSY